MVPARLLSIIHPTASAGRPKSTGDVTALRRCITPGSSFTRTRRSAAAQGKRCPRGSQLTGRAFPSRRRVRADPRLSGGVAHGARSCENIAWITGLADESVCHTLVRKGFAFLRGRRFRLPTDFFTLSQAVGTGTKTIDPRRGVRCSGPALTPRSGPFRPFIPFPRLTPRAMFFRAIGLNAKANGIWPYSGKCAS